MSLILALVIKLDYDYAMSKRATVKELEKLQTVLEGQYTEESEILADLVGSELYRRQRAGRPSSNLTRKEQNRINQANFRERKKLTDKQK